ncbi:MAG: redoxin domain-containing protein [Acidobacteria bacterium]|nr:redoxin domain-containing protein [Acidobacteriota bacterium]
MPLFPKTVHAPEIGPAWINSPPLTLRGLRGRTVLVDFWDYTCVNCLRTLPYLRGWHERYAALGLQVIGVHSPEFVFARTPGHVERAIGSLGIPYPVVLDNDYAIWKAFANKCWPAKYLIDRDGYIRYFQLGEGGYHEMEESIQELLSDLNPGAKMPPLMPPVRAMDAPGRAATCPRPTPELYLGSVRGQLANPGGFVENALSEYQYGGAPPPEGSVEIAGWWGSDRECLAANASRNDVHAARLRLRYSAAEVNLVAAPGEQPSGQIIVRENGGPIPPAARTEDVHENPGGETCLTITAPRMYRLIHRDTFTEGVLELETRSQGVELYAFTFVSCA